MREERESTRLRAEVYATRNTHDDNRRAALLRRIAHLELSAPLRRSLAKRDLDAVGFYRV